jgi:hypothetical protein
MAQGMNVETRRAEMRDHYAQLIAIHDAAVRGDLAAIRKPAAELAVLWVPAGSPPSTTSFGAAAREGARRLSREATVAGAARATSDVIRACAGCHRASGANISADSILRHRAERGQMGGHAEAADDLLLGLLLPSDARWAVGADRLEAVTLPAGQTLPTRADGTLKYLARRARQSTTVTARASTYVLVVATCAECHRKTP